MRYLIDLDGTLCETRGMDYPNARPIWPAIHEVQRLHAAGHHVTIWTARGSGTGHDWRAETREQLVRWAVPYDELSVGEKPVFDVLIDDRAINAGDWRARIAA